MVNLMQIWGQFGSSPPPSEGRCCFLLQAHFWDSDHPFLGNIHISLSNETEGPHLPSLTAQNFAPNQLNLEATSTKMCLRPPQTLAQEPRGLPRDLQKGGILSCAVFMAAVLFLFF